MVDGAHAAAVAEFHIPSLPLWPSVSSVVRRIWIPAFAGMTRSASPCISVHQRFLSRDPWLVPRDPKICPLDKLRAGSYGHTTNSLLRDLRASVVKILSGCFVSPGGNRL